MNISSARQCILNQKLTENLPMKILLVEDSHSLQQSLTAGLKNSGHTVDGAMDGESALGFVSSSSYDIIILDMMLPKLSGESFLRTIRNNGVTTAVLILSARDQVEDRIAGLDIGADDYLVKPFSFDELLSRLRALERRMVSERWQDETSVTLGEITIDKKQRKVFHNGVELVLTPSEYALLDLLVTRKGQVFSHDRLIERLYDSASNVTRNAVEAHVSSLRKKLGSVDQAGLIKTRRGFGYYVE